MTSRKILLASLFLAFASSVIAADFSKSLTVKGRYLLFPIRSDTVEKGANAVKVMVEGRLEHHFWGNLARSKDQIQFWAYVDMSSCVGKEATVQIHRGKQDGLDAVLAMIESSDELLTLKPLYTEKGRPQFHFSQNIGWNNDPNGMFYMHGLYHLSWQSNPFGTMWKNMYWGHAVSKDLVHWEEMPRTIRAGANAVKNMPTHPAMVQNQAFSGGATIDHNNTLGKQALRPGSGVLGDTKTVFVTISDTGGGIPTRDAEGRRIIGESIAYSTDGGFTYTLLEAANPIISHFGRDPKAFWYEPGQHWCLVTYRQGERNNDTDGRMAFYSSKDLINWTPESLTEPVYHECPDMIELPVDGDPSNKKWMLFDATPSYQLGRFDGKAFISDFKGTRRSIGGNLKAGQIFSNAPDGRAIMMVWARFRPADPLAPFNQGFTLPLELTLRTTTDGVRCYANPVQELKALRQDNLLFVNNRKLQSDGNTLALSTPAKHIEVDLTLSYPESQKPKKVSVQLADTTIICDLVKNEFRGDKGRYGPLTSYDKEDGKLSLRIYVDSATVETFAENGAVYFIHNRTQQEAPVKEVVITAQGGQASIEHLHVHQLRSIWEK